jgi:CPA2 family monovalent cation:H+ antiporter-2
MPENSLLVGKTLAQANLRARSGASIVALIQNHQLMPNPKSETIFQGGDRLGVIGEKEQIETFKQILDH